MTIFLLLVKLLLIRCKLSEYLLASTFTKSSHNRGQHGFSRRFNPAGVRFSTRTHSATTYRSGWLDTAQTGYTTCPRSHGGPSHAAEYSAQVCKTPAGHNTPALQASPYMHHHHHHHPIGRHPFMHRSKWNARTKGGSSDKLQIRSRSRGVPYHLPDAVSALIMDQRTRPFS